MDNQGHEADEEAARFMRARLRANEPPTLEADARLGLDRNEFHLLYQVRVEPATEDVCGVEALLRWRDTYRGTMAPGLFLPALADTQVMGRLGRWVLSQACIQAARWESRRPADRPRIVVAVNATAVQALHDGFVEFVGNAVAISRIDPTLLQLEVGARSSELDEELLHERLDALRDLGVVVALDAVDPRCGADGNFPPSHGLNLARRWVRSVVTDRRVATQVDDFVRRAHDAGRWVCAVGVETSAQAEALAALGCDTLQGFRFGEPVAASELGWQVPSTGPAIGGPAAAPRDPSLPSSSKSAMTAGGPLPKRQRRAG